MIPIANHVYSCIWKPGTYTYINLVISTDYSYVYGRCIYSDEPNYLEDAPGDVEYIKWKLSYWNEEMPDAIITDLGHIDDLPELLI